MDGFEWWLWWCSVIDRVFFLTYTKPDISSTYLLDWRPPLLSLRWEDRSLFLVASSICKWQCLSMMMMMMIRKAFVSLITENNKIRKKREKKSLDWISFFVYKQPQLRKWCFFFLASLRLVFFSSFPCVVAASQTMMMHRREPVTIFNPFSSVVFSTLKKKTEK